LSCAGNYTVIAVPGDYFFFCICVIVMESNVH